MELFRDDGCLTDEGLQSLTEGRLDELGRLEAAEHLSYCDKCMDRYTALLTADVLEEPSRSAHSAVMGTIWVRLMQNTWGRTAVAAVAAVLALTMWRSGTLEQLINARQQLSAWTQSASQSEEEQPQRLGCPVEDKRKAAELTEEKPLGKPVEDTEPKTSASLTEALNTLLFGKHTPKA